VSDSIFTGLQVARTVFALASSDADYRGSPGRVPYPISRPVDIGFGLGFTALFLSSAVYGFQKTGKCRRHFERMNYSGWTSLRASAIAGLQNLPSKRLALRPPGVGAAPLGIDLLPASTGDDSADREFILSTLPECDEGAQPGLNW
jgi:hypothetical protein